MLKFALDGVMDATVNMEDTTLATTDSIHVTTIYLKHLLHYE